MSYINTHTHARSEALFKYYPYFNGSHMNTFKHTFYSKTASTVLITKIIFVSPFFVSLTSSIPYFLLPTPPAPLQYSTSPTITHLSILDDVTYLSQNTSETNNGKKAADSFLSEKGPCEQQLLFCIRFFILMRVLFLLHI